MVAIQLRVVRRGKIVSHIRATYIMESPYASNSGKMLARKITSCVLVGVFWTSKRFRTSKKNFTPAYGKRLLPPSQFHVKGQEARLFGVTR